MSECIEKIAVPVFNGRVSPRFDCAPVIMVVTTINGRMQREEQQHFSCGQSMARLEFCLKFLPKTLICGGIDRLSFKQLTLHRVIVINGITGCYKEAIDDYLSGQLSPSSTVDNTPCRCQRRRRCRSNRKE